MKKILFVLALCLLVFLGGPTGCLPSRSGASSAPTESVSTQSSPAPPTSYTPESDLPASSAESGGESSSESGEESSEASEESSDVPAAVSVGETHTEVTVPAEFFRYMPPEELVKRAALLGLTDHRTNADGSMTFTMTETLRQTAVATLALALKSYAYSLPGKASRPGLVGCELNNTFDALVLLVDEALYTEADHSAATALYVPVSLYRLFLGEERENISLAVTVKNADGTKTLAEFTVDGQ